MQVRRIDRLKRGFFTFFLLRLLPWPLPLGFVAGAGRARPMSYLIEALWATFPLFVFISGFCGFS